MSTEVREWMRIRTVSRCFSLTRPDFYSREFYMRIASTVFVLETKNDFSSRIAHINTCKRGRLWVRNPKDPSTNPKNLRLKSLSQNFEIVIEFTEFLDYD